MTTVEPQQGHIQPSVNLDRREVTIVEDGTGEISIPMVAFDKIRHLFPDRILGADTDHITSTCNLRLSMKTYLQTFVRENDDLVQLSSRATSHVIKLLEQVGFHVRCVIPHLPDKTRIANKVLPAHFFREEDFETLTKNRFGQINVASPLDAVRVVADIAQAFPDSPVLFPIAKQADAIGFLGELNKLSDEPIQFAKGIRAIPKARLIVSTFAAAKSVELVDCPIVIFPIWPGQLTEKMKGVIQNLSRERMYFIRIESDRFSVADEEELQHRIGPVIPDLGPPNTTVSHTFYTVRFSSRTRPHQDGTRTGNGKRDEYWQNKRRNRAIAAVAKQIALLASRSQKVVVLVEVPEHARNLGELLDKWQIRINPNSGGLLPTCSIVTLSAASTREDFDPSWVINAMGGPPSKWLTQWLARQSKNGASIRVVDLTDRFSAEAAACSDARQKMYKQTSHWRPLAATILKPALDELRASCR